MESTILNWLDNHFKNTPKDTLRDNWAEIEAMGLVGPMVKEYINFIRVYNSEESAPPQKILIPENITAPNYSELFFYRFAL